MFNELDRLYECAELFELLTYYATLGKEDRTTWHDRLQEFAGMKERDLTRMYGELIAHGWLEQNTGLTPILEPGRHAACYRVTSAGLKIYKQVTKALRTAAG